VVAQVVEHSSEKAGVASASLARGTPSLKLRCAKHHKQNESGFTGILRACPPKPVETGVGGCRIAAITLPCQGSNGGSTPLTRSKLSLLTLSPAMIKW
jgi:hypothetical protein